MLARLSYLLKWSGRKDSILIVLAIINGKMSQNTHFIPRLRKSNFDQALLARVHGSDFMNIQAVLTDL